MRKRDIKKDLIVFNPRNPEWGVCFIVDQDTENTVIIEKLSPDTDKHVRHYAEYGRLKIVTTKDHDIPIFDCPVCKHEDVPLLLKAQMVKGKMSIDIFECGCCGKVPNIENDIEIKYYMSVGCRDNRQGRP